jgi:hypothetical protein
MRISSDKINKIKENILAVLYSKSPQAIYTADIALEIARDEEFIKKLLLEMEKDRLVMPVKKNNKGISYLRRARWRLSSHIFEAYDKISRQKIEYDDKNHTYSY